MSGARVVNRIAEFTAEREFKAARAMTGALVLGASEASVLTPVDTSNLLNSQWRDVRVSRHHIVGTVGYSADYAQPVHDPEHKQNFRRPSAQKEFLKEGFARAEPSIRAVILGALKV